MNTQFARLKHEALPMGKRVQRFTLAVSAKRAVTDQIEQEMCKAQITKNALALRMGTSRAAVNRLLDPDNTSITLNTLEKVALALNKRLKVELS